MFDSREHVVQHLAAVKKRDFKQPITCIDLETDGLYGKITMAGVATAEDVYAVPQVGDAFGTGELKAPITNHNIKYDVRCLAQEGHALPYGLILDTMPAGHLLDENQRLGLEHLVLRYLGINDPEWAKGWSPHMGATALRAYAMKDADYTRRLTVALWPRLRDEGFLNQWLRVECPLALISAEMEMRGIRIDRTMLEQRSKETATTLTSLRPIMHALHREGPWLCQREGCQGGAVAHKRTGKLLICRVCDGTGLNPTVLSSNKVLSKILFEDFALEPVSFTDKGNPSTNHESLLRLRDQSSGDQSQFIHRLLEYRKLEKLQNGFFLPYLENGGDRLHPNFRPWGTVTGRWSCSDPNMQQVPSSIRNIFIPDEGRKFVSVDFDQLELYLVGALAGEKGITDVYSAGGDLHSQTAGIAGVSRSVGKTINFALLYGLAPRSLAGRLGISEGQARQIKDRVFGTYRALHTFLEDTKEFARRNGYVETLFGRKRRLPEINALDFKERGHAENQAVNAVVQGTAADLIKAVTIDCKINVPEALPVLQVHDELVFSVPTAQAHALASELQRRFEQIVVRQLQPKATAEVQDRWA